MQLPFTRNFIIAAALIFLAVPLSLMGVTILALPMGIIGGIIFIREMFGQIF
jgi:hypothetical protein